MEDRLVSLKAAIDALKGLEFCHYMEFGEYIGEDTREVRLIRAEKAQDALQNLPSAQPEIKPIDYQDCANAMLRMWMDTVVTDGEYCRIMDKLNAFWRTNDALN